jgi:toxin ParE1/3/4
MAEVVWAEPAAKDLEEIAEYISLDNPPAAERLIHRVLSRTRQLEKHPKSGPVLQDFANSHYRYLIEPPCKIFYTFDGTTVYILRVLRTERLIRLSFFDETE